MPTSRGRGDIAARGVMIFRHAAYISERKDVMYVQDNAEFEKVIIDGCQCNLVSCLDPKASCYYRCHKFCVIFKSKNEILVIRPVGITRSICPVDIWDPDAVNSP